MQYDVAGHATPNMSSALEPDGFGVLCVTHELPFQN